MTLISSSRQFSPATSNVPMRSGFGWPLTEPSTQNITGSVTLTEIASNNVADL